VVIPKSTPWVKCAIQDMWMGQEIVNLLGYQAEWTDETILEYLGDLVYAKENWDRYQTKVGLVVGQSNYARLRQEIRKRLQSPGSPSILDVAKELQLNHGELMFLLFTGRRYMPINELVDFERDVKERRYATAHSLGKKYGMTHKSALTLHSYWGVPFGERQDVRPPDQVLVDTLIETQRNLSVPEILRIVKIRFGKDTNQTLPKIRYRKHYLLKTKIARTVNAKSQS
jgi:hypothetical protein